MKKNKFCTVIMALIVSSRAFAIDGNANNNFTRQQMDTLRKYLWQLPVNTEVAIAMVQNDKVIYGGIIIGKDSFHVVENRDSIFEIGSLSKVFTSVLLSSFVNSGIVKTTDELKSFFSFPLKESSLNGKEITLENLANHTSGLPRVDPSMFSALGIDMNNPYKVYDEKALDDYLQHKMKLDTVPGTKFSYSNLGGGLLGFVLCKKANKTYEELVQEYIFRPLGMKNSTTNLALVKGRLVKGRNMDGDTAESWTFTDATAGAGAIRSDAEDLVKFMQANFTENKVYDLPRQKTFTDKPGMDIGLGWIIKTTAGKDDIYWHNGGTGGYRTCLAMDVKKKSGIIILSNVSSFHSQNANIDKLCFALLRSLK